MRETISHLTTESLEQTINKWHQTTKLQPLFGSHKGVQRSWTADTNASGYKPLQPHHPQHSTPTQITPYPMPPTHRGAPPFPPPLSTTPLKESLLHQLPAYAQVSLHQMPKSARQTPGSPIDSFGNQFPQHRNHRNLAHLRHSWIRDPHQRICYCQRGF